MSEGNSRPPQFIPAHGRGLLNRGGVKGHAGGGGRPPSEVRKISRQAYESRVPRLLAIVDDPESKPSEVIAAMALLERNGFGQRLEVDTGMEAPPPVDREAIMADIISRLPRIDNDEEPRRLLGPTPED